MTWPRNLATAAWFAFVGLCSFGAWIMAYGWQTCHDIGVGEEDAIFGLMFFFLLPLVPALLLGWVASRARIAFYILIPAGIAFIAATFAITYALAAVAHWPCSPPDF
jgi:hypothetical protein